MLSTLMRLPLVGFVIKLILRATVFCILVSVLLVWLFKVVNPPITWLMIARNIERKHNDKAYKLKKHWLSYQQIPESVKRAAIAAEDQTFATHNGFDYKAIERAYKLNRAGGSIRGGSTISQQTAKNLFLWPERSWLRKGLESYFTMLIEFMWSKQRILEVYLNIAEMGDGVYGIDAASQTYFDKDATQLKKTQSALIIACLPNPRLFSPKTPSAYIRRRQHMILVNMPLVKLPK